MSVASNAAGDEISLEFNCDINQLRHYFAGAFAPVDNYFLPCGFELGLVIGAGLRSSQGTGVNNMLTSNGNGRPRAHILI